MTRAERTRTILVTTALELFAEHGYDATTTATIASRAGVSEMTLFRHFPSKDALLLDDPYDPMIADAVLRQPRSRGPLAAAIGGVADAWRSVPAQTSDQVRARLRIVSRTPSLRGATARNTARTEATIAEALVARGTSSADARIAAAATLAALSAALLVWADGSEPDLGAALTEARRVLTGGTL